MVGRTLNRYRLVEQVGHGGMAVVFRGVDESLERDVAVKLLHPHLAERVEHRRRLAREAKAVARLRHPNILEIFDFSGEDSSEAYLVTELIKGRTLKVFAAAHPFTPPEIAAACVHELAGALAHAHAAGIIHRDLKPENVMIQEAGAEPAIKLMDFGIAQIIDRDDKMTVTGSLMGSPAHMAPEIIDGEEADARSDIFSLGTILYFLVTGSLPFEAASPGALLKKILEGDFTDPRTLKPDVSDCLARVIADSLARDRNQRITSALELQKRLQAVLSESGLERSNELLTRFLKSPAETTRETREHVVGVLMNVGAEAAKAGKVGKALSTYGRVIAIAPGTPEAGAARDAIDRMKSRVRWRKRGIAAAVLASVGAVLLVVKPYRFLHSTPTPKPIAVVTPTPRPSPEAMAPRGNNIPGLDVRSGSGEASSSPKPTPIRQQLPSVLPSPSPKVIAATAKQTAPPVVNVPFMVKSSPWGAVYIDGNETPIATTTVPPAELSLPAGEHVIEIRQACCETFSKRVKLVPGRAMETVSARLRMAATMTLNLKGPPETVVKIDGAIRDTIGKVGGRPLPVQIYFPDDKSTRFVSVALCLGDLPPQERRIAFSAGDKKVIDLEWTGTP